VVLKGATAKSLAVIDDSPGGVGVCYQRRMCRAIAGVPGPLDELQGAAVVPVQGVDEIATGIPGGQAKQTALQLGGCNAGGVIVHGECVRIGVGLVEVVHAPQGEDVAHRAAALVGPAGVNCLVSGGRVL